MKQQTQEQENRGKSKAFFLLFFFILSVACIILGVCCLNGISSPVVQKHFLALSVAIGLIVCGLCTVSVWFTLAGKTAIAKGIFSFYILALFSLAIWLILQKTGFFEVVDTPEKLQEYLGEAGVWMPIFYIALQFLQVVVLPIPSIVSTVAGVALFGAFWTMIYSLAGILLGSLTAFFIGRKLGNKAVVWMVGEESLQKWQKKLKGKDNLFLTLMFLLPLFPDDILCFVAGLSTMTTRYFLILIFLSRVLAISATCYSIDFIPFNTWWGIALWCVFLVGIAVAFFLIYKNMDKIQRIFRRLQRKLRKKK